MITTTIASFKGGTAKTSTVLHLGSALASFHDKRVLLIDFDSQANLSSGLGFGCDSLDTMVPVLQGEKCINEVIKETSVPGLFLIPGNTFLDGVERSNELINDPYNHERLRNALQGQAFDHVIIDTTPSLGWLTQSSFYASDFSILTMTAEPYSVLAANRLKKFHAMINKHHPVKLGGVLFNIWDSRLSTNEAFVAGIEEIFPNMLFTTRVRRDIAISRSILHGKPVFDVFPKSNVVLDFKNLAIEFLEKVKGHNG